MAVAAVPLRAAALARACHPEPTVAVTAFAAVLAITAGNSAPTCVLLAAAVLTGQLSIGWSNDRLDAAADRSVGRADKPLATGALTLRTIDAAAASAVAACIGLSLTLGWRAGLLHLAAVGCGWLYNLRLKRTWVSWLPYAAAFGALPGVATLALPGHPAPAAWVVVVAALLGVAANLTNALPDLEDDRATGNLGLAGRLGAGPALLVATALFLAATAWVAFAAPGAPTWLSWTGLALAVATVLVTAPFARRRSHTRLPFFGLIALALIDLVLTVGTGHHLH